VTRLSSPSETSGKDRTPGSDDQNIPVQELGEQALTREPISELSPLSRNNSVEKNARLPRASPTRRVPNSLLARSSRSEQCMGKLHSRLSTAVGQCHRN